MDSHPVANQISTDLRHYISQTSDENQKRVNHTVQQIANILYTAMMFEYDLYGGVIQSHVAKACSVCHRWDKNTGNSINIQRVCPACMGKKAPKKLRAEIQVKYMKTGLTKMITIAKGDTVSELMGIFGSFAMHKGYAVFTDRKRESYYTNPDGNIMFLDKEKKIA